MFKLHNLSILALIVLAACTKRQAAFIEIPKVVYFRTDLDYVPDADSWSDCQIREYKLRYKYFVLLHRYLVPPFNSSPSAYRLKGKWREGLVIPFLVSRQWKNNPDWVLEDTCFFPKTRVTSDYNTFSNPQYPEYLWMHQHLITVRFKYPRDKYTKGRTFWLWQGATFRAAGHRWRVDNVVENPRKFHSNAEVIYVTIRRISKTPQERKNDPSMN